AEAHAVGDEQASDPPQRDGFVGDVLGTQLRRRRVVASTTASLGEGLAAHTVTLPALPRLLGAGRGPARRDARPRGHADRSHSSPPAPVSARGGAMPSATLQEP